MDDIAASLSPPSMKLPRMILRLYLWHGQWLGVGQMSLLPKEVKSLSAAPLFEGKGEVGPRDVQYETVF